MGARVLRSDPRGEYGNAGVKVKHVRRKDFDPENRIVHIRTSKNEMSKRVIPLNDSAFEEVERMIRRADLLGHTEPTHYLWCASQHHQLDPSKPAANWHTAWRALRDAAGLPGLRFHDLRHTVVTRLLEAGEPDHVVESITGHLSRRMLEPYSHIRLKAKKAALDRVRKGRNAEEREMTFTVTDRVGQEGESARKDGSTLTPYPSPYAPRLAASSSAPLPCGCQLSSATDTNR